MYKRTTNFEDLNIEYELDSVSTSLQQVYEQLPVEITYVTPTKIKVGTIAYADGTNWDPGLGEGVYAYTSDGWRKLAFEGSP